MYASETIQNCKNPTGHIDTLMTLQTCWSLFFEIRPIFGFFVVEIFDIARLTAEISHLARENRPPEKTVPRN